MYAIACQYQKKLVTHIAATNFSPHLHQSIAKHNFKYFIHWSQVNAHREACYHTMDLDHKHQVGHSHAKWSSKSGHISINVL
jgi:hypothetical protein